MSVSYTHEASTFSLHEFQNIWVHFHWKWITLITLQTLFSLFAETSQVTASFFQYELDLWYTDVAHGIVWQDNHIIYHVWNYAENDHGIYRSDIINNSFEIGYQLE